MKLAHLILAHNHPDQLMRLANALAHKDADIYVHLDLKASVDEYKSVFTLPNVYFIKNRMNVVWCEYSTIKATLNSMEEILASKVEYSHINLLSGNDYPLKPASQVQEFLFRNADKSFMWYDRIFNDWSHGQVRMNTMYFGDYGFPGRYQLTNLIKKILPKRRLPNGLVAFGRSQWMTLTPECVKYTLDYIKENPSVERFFKMTWAVDEVFFQTILCNSHLIDNVVNDNLRYIVLNSEYRPVSYTMADADSLLNSGKFYARKFDAAVDENIFNFLDKNIGLKD